MTKLKYFKLAVVGSRTINDKKLVRESIHNVCELNKDTGPLFIISGGARGVDSIAVDYAKEKGHHYTEYLPNWDGFGKSAGFIRNKDIVDACDALLCIWDGKSKGARHSYDLAVKQGKKVYLITK